MMNSNMTHEMIKEELDNYQPQSIDDWNREYDEIVNELNSYVATYLLDITKYDESYHYEKYEQTNQREADQFAQTYDPENNSFYICAICKRYVYRVKGSQVICERPGCINLNLGVRKYIF